MKIKELQERYGLKTRQSIYDWIKAANLTLPKDERGHAYATPEQIEVLDQLVEHLKQGGTLGSFTPVSSPEIYTTADSQIDTSEPSTVYQIVDTVNSTEDSPMVMLERLVGVIVSNIQSRSRVGSWKLNSAPTPILFNLFVGCSCGTPPPTMLPPVCAWLFLWRHFLASLVVVPRLLSLRDILLLLAR